MNPIRLEIENYHCHSDLSQFLVLPDSLLLEKYGPFGVAFDADPDDQHHRAEMGL